MKTVVLFLLILVTTASCYYDVEEELYSCSIDPASAKFSTVITPLLNSYGCSGCHNGTAPSGGVNLSTHAQVKTVADNGRLYGAINHAPGFVPMPLGASKMADCDVRKIKAWIDGGALNN